MVNLKIEANIISVYSKHTTDFEQLFKSLGALGPKGYVQEDERIGLDSKTKAFDPDEVILYIGDEAKSTFLSVGCTKVRQHISVFREVRDKYAKVISTEGPISLGLLDETRIHGKVVGISTRREAGITKKWDGIMYTLVREEVETMPLEEGDMKKSVTDTIHLFIPQHRL